jgi:hypothetical protein
LNKTGVRLFAPAMNVIAGTEACSTVELAVNVTLLDAAVNFDSRHGGLLHSRAGSERNAARLCKKLWPKTSSAKRFLDSRLRGNDNSICLVVYNASLLDGFRFDRFVTGCAKSGKVYRMTLSRWKIREIRELFADGKSFREISRKVGIHRNTVAKYVLAGDSLDVDADSVDGLEEFLGGGPLSRCPECGGMVFMPCKLCETRKYLYRRIKELRCV